MACAPLKMFLNVLSFTVPTWIGWWHQSSAVTLWLPPCCGCWRESQPQQQRGEELEAAGGHVLNKSDFGDGRPLHGPHIVPSYRSAGSSSERVCQTVQGAPRSWEPGNFYRKFFFLIFLFPLFSLRTSIKKKQELDFAQHPSVRCREKKAGNVPEMDVSLSFRTWNWKESLDIFA